MSDKPTREGLVILSARAFNQGRPKEEIAAALMSHGCDRREAAKLMAIAASRVSKRKAEQRAQTRTLAYWTICAGAALIAAVLSVYWERTAAVAMSGF